MQETVTIVCAYLLGCLTSGYYLVRLLTGEDIRTIASGNAGSRNVGRRLGAIGFILTLAADAGKGMTAVWLAQRLLQPLPWLAVAALLAVTAGHIWPLQLGFKGGKGLATFAGGLLLLKPLLLLAGLLLCVVLYPFLRGTTKCALIALAATPFILFAANRRAGIPLLTADTVLFCLLVIMVLFAHRTNIRQEFCATTIAKESAHAR